MFVFIPNYQFALYCGFAVTELFLHVLKKQNSMYQKIPNCFLGFFQLPRLIKIRRNFKKMSDQNQEISKKRLSLRKRKPHTFCSLTDSMYNVQIQSKFSSDKVLFPKKSFFIFLF